MEALLIIPRVKKSLMRLKSLLKKRKPDIDPDKAARVNFLITGDKDFLSLKRFENTKKYFLLTNLLKI